MYVPDCDYVYTRYVVKEEADCNVILDTQNISRCKRHGHGMCWPVTEFSVSDTFVCLICHTLLPQDGRGGTCQCLRMSNFIKFSMFVPSLNDFCTTKGLDCAQTVQTDR